jgi:CheY-like chemotaxis protein
MAKLVVISKGQAGPSYELGTHWVTIGRAPGNDFQIIESSVSGHHCEVLLRGDELAIRDMQSTNGTFIKGAVIAEGAIKLGGMFRLGDVELRLEASAPSGPVINVLATRLPASPAATTNASTRTVSVLLVDDSMAFLETASELFRAMSHDAWEILTAPAADEALAVLQERRIDLVVLDIVMPMLDGGQLLTVIHRRYPAVRKVVLTGNLTESNRTACLAAGAELVLEKPTAKDGFKGVFNLLHDLVAWSQREGFSGTLRHVGLVDVIQLQCIGRKSCILEVRDAETHGEIYIETGAIIHAATGSLVGDQAFYKLLSLGKGEFHLAAFRPPAEQTVQGAWEYLLMEASRQRDEERAVCATADTIHLTKNSPSANEALPDFGEEIVVVSTYDGQWHPIDGKK